jgi:hypothetical protein
VEDGRRDLEGEGRVWVTWEEGRRLKVKILGKKMIMYLDVLITVLGYVTVY